MALTVDQKIALLVVITVPIGVLATFLNGPYFHSPGQHYKKFIISIFAFFISFIVLVLPLYYSGILEIPSLRSLLVFGAPAPPTPTHAPVTPPPPNPASSLLPDETPQTSARPSVGPILQQSPTNPQDTSTTKRDYNIRPDVVAFWFKQGFSSTTKKDIPVFIWAPQAEVQYEDKNAATKLSKLLALELNIVHDRLDAAIIIEISKVYYNGTPAPNRDCPFSKKLSAWDGEAGITVRMAWNGGRDFFLPKTFTDSHPSCDQETAANVALEAVLANIKETVLGLAGSKPQ